MELWEYLALTLIILGPIGGAFFGERNSPRNNSVDPGHDDKRVLDSEDEHRAA